MSQIFLDGEGVTVNPTVDQHAPTSKMRASVVCLGLHWFAQPGHSLRIETKEKLGAEGSRAEL